LISDDQKDEGLKRVAGSQNKSKVLVMTEVELTTYDSKTYCKLNQAVESHKAQVVKPEDLPKMLP